MTHYRNDLNMFERINAAAPAAFLARLACNAGG